MQILKNFIFSNNYSRKYEQESAIDYSDLYRYNLFIFSNNYSKKYEQASAIDYSDLMYRYNLNF